ncbi:hypothetical protein CI104_05825 [Citrobacter farmeri]|uniref:Uncharacterized protein n=1 Tax=Citrobacter farmeri TaxID=67824 RepID=A0ACA8D366_9ENTR|nr:hypothetical protein CI104_05825 [Citrobacter farmeri]
MSKIATLRRGNKDPGKVLQRDSWANLFYIMQAQAGIQVNMKFDLLNIFRENVIRIPRIHYDNKE